MNHAKVSLCLVSFNHEDFIAQAVESALNQDRPPHEIILSDDSSSDRTFEIMSELAKRYRGPSRVIVSRNDSNIGVSAHVSKIMMLGTGDVILIIAGDDVAQPWLVRKCTELFEERPDMMVLCSNPIVIDETGQELGVLVGGDKSKYQLDWQNYMQSVPVLFFINGWRRDVVELFGPLRTHSTEDHEILFRGGLLGRIHYVNLSLNYYRRHSGNESQFERVLTNDVGVWRSAQITITRRNVDKFDAWTADLKTAAAQNLIHAGEMKHALRRIRRHRAFSISYLEFIERGRLSLGGLARGMVTGFGVRELTLGVAMAVIPSLVRVIVERRQQSRIRGMISTDLATNIRKRQEAGTVR